jgi:hypothetical protein
VFYRGKYGSTATPHYVLLDVVEEACGIAMRNTREVEIDCPFLLLEGAKSKVRIPNVHALLGDKLTAFAPNTTGVPFASPRRMEDSAHQVFKQLFDVAQLFGCFSDFGVFRTTFLDVVRLEAEYKNVKGVPESVLNDIVKTAFDITTFDIRRRKLDSNYERLIRSGIDKMHGDLINGGRFGVIEAKTAAAKAAYLAALLLRRKRSVTRYSGSKDVIEKLVANRMSGQFLVLDKLKKANALEAYFYWNEVLHLLPDLPMV